MSSATKNKHKRVQGKRSAFKEYQDKFKAPMRSMNKLNDRGQMKKLAKLYPKQFK